MATYGIYEPISIKGQKGESGPQGPRGQDGFQGIAGQNGLNGAAGKQGKQGYKGSIGPSGEKGDRGTIGERGERGQIGPTGTHGPTGVTGPIGTNQGNFSYTFCQYSLTQNLAYKAWYQNDVDVNFDYNTNLNYNIDNQGYAYMILPGVNDNAFLDKSIMNFESGANFNKLITLGLQSNYLIPLGHHVNHKGYINTAEINLISDSISTSKPGELVYLADQNIYIGYRVSIEIHGANGNIPGQTALTTWPKYTRKEIYLHDSVQNKLQTNVSFVKTSDNFKGYENMVVDNDHSSFNFTTLANLNVKNTDFGNIYVNKGDIICIGFTPIYATKSSNFVGVNPKNQIIKEDWNNFLKLKSINVNLNLIKI